METEQLADEADVVTLCKHEGCELPVFDEGDECLLCLMARKQRDSAVYRRAQSLFHAASK